jgi:methionyl-tRNA formyltransferase
MPKYRLNVFLSGQKYFGYLIYNLLRELDHNIVGVCAPVGDRLHKRASLLGGSDMIVIPSGTGNLNVNTLPPDIDLIICAHSHEFIGLKTLAKSKLGGIGYHPSLLPLHRGRDAVKWSIKMGDRVTGGSVYWLNKTVDGGPIAAQDWCFIPPGVDARGLWRETLQPMGVELMRRTLDDVANGVIVKVPQDHNLATWEPSLDPPSLYRPDLPQIGTVPGFTVNVTSSTVGGYKAPSSRSRSPLTRQQ